MPLLVRGSSKPAKNPIWYRERTFMPQRKHEQLTSHDYPHATTARLRYIFARFTVLNTSQTPCDFRMTIYGYAVNPSVSYCGQHHGVDVTVPDGGLLVIDSTGENAHEPRQCRYHDCKYYNATDAFKYRVRGIESLGSYIFQRRSRSICITSLGSNRGVLT